ncbi:hypothetical protein VIOR3934_13032 [Vibrio orientalis CIP 102891 = ATCC 33934]|uniref:Lipoprotein n=1 Tax=Vibrio orientalis CIP 102891 = ATCC 33934 TaxID=675816 RepID=F9SY47_VIBOR|nr:hypothetical protein [Vibrio orientalis]EGU45973.1 hypothetical protein VIOR3934_13032 [Vibrio orientalis CIP 102891 = ATCC 33934]
MRLVKLAVVFFALVTACTKVSANHFLPEKIFCITPENYSVFTFDYLKNTGRFETSTLTGHQSFSGPIAIFKNDQEVKVKFSAERGDSTIYWDLTFTGERDSHYESMSHIKQGNLWNVTEEHYVNERCTYDFKSYR